MAGLSSDRSIAPSICSTRSPSITDEPYKSQEDVSWLLPPRGGVTSNDSSSTLGSQPDHYHQQEDFARLLPFLIVPSALKPGATLEQQRTWVPEEHMATEWLNLFYDLALVAVLTIFSSLHEISDPIAAARFFSFFVLMWWTWCTQVLFDVRFQTNDMVHRFVKILQLTFFVFLGAAGTRWNPLSIRVIPDVADPRSASHFAAHESFILVIMALGATRLLLLAQYVLVVCLSRRTNRPWRALVYPISVIVISLVLNLQSALLPSNTIVECRVKVALLYLSVAVEVAGEIVASFDKAALPYPPQRLSERFGTLTLIVIGEGFLGIVRSFGRGVGLFSSNDSTTYLQVFLSILTLFFLWSFVFSGFNKNAWMGRRRSYFWVLLHFPMHFLLLLVFAGQVNVIIFSAFNAGPGAVMDDYLAVLASVLDHQYDPIANASVISRLANNIGQLQIMPTFTTVLSTLNDTSLPGSTINGHILGVQYLSSILYTSAEDYGLELTSEAQALYRTVSALAAGLDGNSTVDQGGTTAADELMHDLLGTLLNDSFKGTTWFLPCAGALLVVLGLLRLVRSSVQGIRVRVMESLMLLVGVGLSLLGCLDLGNYSFKIEIDPQTGEPALDPLLAPIFALVLNNWAVPLVAIFYSVVFFADLGLLAWSRSQILREGFCAA